MGFRQLQFFASVKEIKDLISTCVKEMNVQIVAVESRTRRVFSVRPDDLSRCLDQESVCALVLIPGAVELGERDAIGLARTYPDAVEIQIGRVGASGLTESALSTGQSSAEGANLAASIRRLTTAGMIGEAEGTGRSAKYRTARYSPDAAGLHAAGVPLRQFPDSLVRMRPIEPAVPRTSRKGGGDGKGQ